MGKFDEAIYILIVDLISKKKAFNANKCTGIWTRRYAENRVCLGQTTVDEFLTSVGALPIGGQTNEINVN